MEDCKLIDVEKSGDIYKAIVKTHEGEYLEYHTPVLLMHWAPKETNFARSVGIRNGIISR
jgi:hypothetical protein